MTFLQRAIAHAVQVCAIAVLAGLLVRRRVKECRSVVGYLLVVIVGASLTTFWGARFHTVEFWVMRQWLFDALKAAIGVEIAYYVFRAFPGAHGPARLAVFGALAATTIAAAAIPRHTDYVRVFDWQPAIAAATIWLYAGTALLVLYYRLPVRAWHRAILMGLTVYNLVFAIVMDTVRRLGLDTEYYDELGLAESSCYLAMMAWWARVAWSRDPDDDVPPEVRKRLGLHE